MDVKNRVVALDRDWPNVRVVRPEQLKPLLVPIAPAISVPNRHNHANPPKDGAMRGEAAIMAAPFPKNMMPRHLGQNVYRRFRNTFETIVIIELFKDALSEVNMFRIANIVSKIIV